jgi:hypothetical protein
MLEDIANGVTIIAFLLPFAAGVVGGVAGTATYLALRPVWRRLAGNLRRQIAVISTEQQSMNHEADLLDGVGYFTVTRHAADVRTINLIPNARLLVVGYTDGSAVYHATLSHARTNKLPIIVFAGNNRLTPADLADLKSYSFSSLCETQLRLVSDVFSVMSTFPEKRP